MKNIFLLFMVAVLFSACGAGSRETSEQQLEGKKWDEVMANHDVVMPMMGTTHKVRKALKAYQSSKGTLEQTEAAAITKMLTDLDKADESMMDWMQKYQKLGKLQDSKSHAEIMKYLENEEVRINKVKELMESSIAAGQAFLKQ